MSGLSASRRSTTSATARRQLLIVLNDNEMSISPTVGAFSQVPLADQAVGGLAAEQDAPTTGVVERIPVVGADALLELSPAAPRSRS